MHKLIAGVLTPLLFPSPWPCHAKSHCYLLDGATPRYVDQFLADGTLNPIRDWPVRNRRQLVADLYDLAIADGAAHIALRPVRMLRRTT